MLEQEGHKENKRMFAIEDRREDTTWEEKMEVINSVTPARLYDMIFWTSVNQLKRYVPALVNEAFGKQYTKDAVVSFKSGKQVTDRPDEGMTWREGDAFINLEENGHNADYHFECESDGRNTIALRIVEYASGYAAQSASMIEDGAVIRIPHSAVIYLRSGSGKTKELTMWIEFPGGKVSYKVPVIRMRSYTVKSLFDKELMVLTPFVPFLFSDRDYATMEKNGIGKLEKMVDDFCARLNEMVEKREIEPWERGNLMRHMQEVLSKRTQKFERINKEATKIMGGRLIKTDIDIAMEEAAEIATQTTRDTERVTSIRNLIETEHFTAERAMNSLRIPAEQQGKYLKLLEEANVLYDEQ